MKESVNLQPGERLSLALKASRPFKVFQSLPSEDLYLMMLDGEEEDVELAIKYATEGQHRDMIDFYVWEKDEIHPELVMRWLARILKCGERKLMRVIAKLDPEILIYTFKSYIHVLTLDDPNDPIPEVEDSRSGPRSIDDNFFYYHLQGHDIEVIDTVLLYIFSLNYRAYWNLMQGCMHELSMDLMENAFRWRANRLEDRGFSNFVDSQGIFAEFDMEEIENFKRIPREAPCPPAIPADLKVVTHSYFFGLAGVTFLQRVFARVEERQDIHDLQGQVVLGMNKLISASLPAMNDIKKIKGCVQKGLETVSLALDYLSVGDLDHAACFLSEIRIETLFRIGNSLITNLAGSLRGFFHTSMILNRETLFLLDSPRSELVRGILKSPPLFFDSERGLFQNFEKKKQLDLASRTLQEAICLDRLFYDKFKLQLEGLEKIGERRLFQDALTFANLFVSGICNVILQGHFTFEPIGASCLAAILEKGFQKTEAGFILRRQYDAEFNGWFGSLTSDWKEQDRQLCIGLLRSWLGEFCDEFASLDLSREIDPRFIRTVLCHPA